MEFPDLAVLLFSLGIAHLALAVGWTVTVVHLGESEGRHIESASAHFGRNEI